MGFCSSSDGNDDKTIAPGKVTTKELQFLVNPVEDEEEWMKDLAVKFRDGQRDEQ